MDRLGVRERRGLVLASCELPTAVGDSVIVGVHEDTLLRGSLLVYLFPLLALFAAALAVQALGLAEPAVIGSGLAGFALSWLVIRRLSARSAGDPRSQPVVLRHEAGNAQPGLS